MNRAKMRKLVAVLPNSMPEEYLAKALAKINNPKTRARVESRYRRRQGSR